MKSVSNARPFDRRVRKDDAKTGPGAPLGGLPEWNLADLYSAPDGADLKADLVAAETRIAAFEKHRGQVAALDGAAFGLAIADYEAIGEILGKIGSYAQLYQSVDVADPKRGKFYQDTSDALTVLGGRTLFFTLEINRLDEKTLAEKMRHPSAAKYAPWVRDLRVFRDHELSDDLEKLFLDKSITSRASWVRLYDETLAAMRCKVGDKQVTLTEALHQLSDPSGEKRKVAAKAVGAALEEKAQLFTLITNTLAKDKAVEDEWRKYPRPVSSRNLGNLVEDEVVQALVTAAKESFAGTAHRYYSLKAKWFGKDKLDYWDRNAPLPQKEDRKIAWPEARDTVLNAYRAFTPGM
ncbi:MAG: oligoendopeptidase F, partial [Rhodospirillaceae bacterium]|nr:oligoendopeptidase F [Rhodospirillaceae bacterium]